MNEPVGLDVIKFINCWWEIYDQQAWAFQLQKKYFISTNFQRLNDRNTLMYLETHQCIQKYTDVFGNTSMHSKIH